MTSFEGASPSDVSDARIEAADPSTVIASEAAEHLEQSTGEAVAEVTEELPGDEPAEEPAEEAPVEEEDVDPAVALKKDLRSKPGNWYVIHSYAGYENKVKANLETRVQNLDVGDYIFQVEVPTEEVTEIKNGQRKQVNRKVLPGYILVRMDLTDESWSAVRNTPGVTGFVGATSKPSALTLDDVVKFLLPQGAAKKAGEVHLRWWGGGVRVRWAGTAGRARRLRGRRVGHRHGWSVRDAARLDQRGQRGAAEAQGAGVHLRPRDARRIDLHPGLEDLKNQRNRKNTSWPPRRRRSPG